MSKKAKPIAPPGAPRPESVPLNGVVCTACECVLDREEPLPQLYTWSYVSLDAEQDRYHRTLQAGFLCETCQAMLPTLPEYTAPEPVPGFFFPELAEP